MNRPGRAASSRTAGREYRLVETGVNQRWDDPGSIRRHRRSAPSSPSPISHSVSGSATAGAAAGAAPGGRAGAGAAAAAAAGKGAAGGRSADGGAPGGSAEL